jgi:hypothetical protein
MGNPFLIAQQMLAQLTTYIVLSLPFYHASITFKFIDTSPLQECAFVLKNVASLKTFPLDSTNIMCPSIIDKYTKRPNYLSNISLIEFFANYDIVNLRGKRGKNSYNCNVHYENNNNYLSLSLIINVLSKMTILHGMQHITCMKYKSIY